MNFDLMFYWKLFVRRAPVMTLFILACASLGVITALKLPETYSTSARLLVEASQIPDSMVTSTIQTDAVEQLDIIQQKLLTRANLIDIANRFDVIENIRELEPDNVERQMRSATNIRRTAGRNRATLMIISFEARSGQIAANVVNEYVTLVLDANASSRTSSAESTLEFFNQEVERLDQELSRKSTEITVFKSENANALPQDQVYRLGRQTLLQERLARLEREKSAGEAQRREVVEIYETTGRVQRGRQQRRQSIEEEQLIVAQAELDQTLSIYSEKHPRVTRLSARIERLKAIVSAQTASSSTDGDDLSPEQALLAVSLAEIDNRLEFIAADLLATQTELGDLQRNISSSSANEVALASLQRDFESVQARYNTVVTNLNQARMSERIEATAQGQRITTIESGSVPSIPAGPNRPKIALTGVAAGITLAAAYFMLLEFMNRTIRRPAEMSGRFDITPIATIPYMESRGRKIARRSALLSATLVILIGVPLGLWYLDTNYLPLELVVQKVLTRIGLG